MVVRGPRLVRAGIGLRVRVFLTGLRQVHNAFHDALGLSHRAAERVMVLLGLVMLGSMHAIKFNHLRHYKDCLGEDDVEGMCARMGIVQTLLFGPIFPLVLHAHALRRG